MSAKIYALRNRNTDDVYIGSTKEKYLSSRFAKHKYTCRNDLPSSCDEIVLCPTAYIELVEECDVRVRYERERYWIENTLNCVNKNLPCSTHQDWVERNAEKVKQYQRDWMREKRTDPDVLEHQRNQAREKRTDPEYRKIENQRQRERRQLKS